MNSRIRYFDSAKGIAILCVILGHSILIVNNKPEAGTIAAFLYHFCFSFHMPLFFILSGYFMHLDRKFNWKKESVELLATYSITSVSIITLNTLIAAITRQDPLLIMKYWTLTALFGAGAPTPHSISTSVGSIGAIWFLLALFWAHLFLHLISSSKLMPLWVILAFIIGYASADYFWLPGSIQAGMTAALFVYIGYIARKIHILALLLAHWYLWAVPGFGWGIFIWRFSGFSMAVNQYGQEPPLAFIGALCGVTCIIGICIFIDNHLIQMSTALSKVGKYTLPILCVHLLEDNTTPWFRVIPLVEGITNGRGVPYVIFIVRLLLDAFLVWSLYHVPKINTVFFPSLMKQQDTSSPVQKLNEDKPRWGNHQLTHQSV